MVIFVSLLALIVLAVWAFTRQPQFGRAPSGRDLTRIQQSPNFKNGRFMNLETTPALAEGHSIAGEFYKLFTEKTPRRYPSGLIPSIKTNLINLTGKPDILVWFGHSSYLLKINGKNFLVDPVFSGNASPVPGIVRSFKGTDIYKAEDMPKIDYLLITHDHYDHLDYTTILELKDKVENVICGLGTGSHLKFWGYLPEKIIEKDWNETIILENDIKIHTLPGRHFSGRQFTRNNTLWLSFVVESSDIKIFIGGDSGYGNHFKEIGKRFNYFDLAILENGQYNAAWHYIHMLPDETLKAARDLNAKRLLPVHSSKFALSRHSWDEPLNELTRQNHLINVPIATPLIGEPVFLDKTDQRFTEWWTSVD